MEELVACMLAKDPLLRPRANEAMLSPAWWSQEKKLLFFIWMYGKADQFKGALGTTSLDHYIRRYFNWQSQPGLSLKVLVQGGATKYKSGVRELVHLIRNMGSHNDGMNGAQRSVFADGDPVTKGDVVSFFGDKFPGLVHDLFIFVADYIVPNTELLSHTRAGDYVGNTDNTKGLAAMFKISRLEHICHLCIPLGSPHQWKGFSSVNGLLSHCADAHHMCALCYDVLPGVPGSPGMSTSLAAHLQSAHSVKLAEKFLECIVKGCNKTFSSSFRWAMHDASHTAMGTLPAPPPVLSGDPRLLPALPEGPAPG